MKKRRVAETLYDPLGFRTEYDAAKVLHEESTGHHSLVLFENPFFGKVLMLDGATQITTRDEFAYSEMMAHVPLIAHGGKKKSVLIIGGGDCSIAKEVLKHTSVERLVQVEIDPTVVQFAKEHFSEYTNVAFADPRFELVIEDGVAYVSRVSREFDVIIVDSTDPQGPGKVLFSLEFYAGCRNSLRPGGVLVTQNGVPFLQSDELVSSVTKFRTLFSFGGCYLTSFPTYVGGHLAIGWASDMYLPDLPEDTIYRRYIREGEFETRYWTPEVQKAAFALPRFISDLIT